MLKQVVENNEDYLLQKYKDKMVSTFDEWYHLAKYFRKN